jgi:hypothetical protein
MSGASSWNDLQWGNAKSSGTARSGGDFHRQREHPHSRINVIQIRPCSSRADVRHRLIPEVYADAVYANPGIIGYDDRNLSSRSYMKLQWRSED